MVDNRDSSPLQLPPAPGDRLDPAFLVLSVCLVYNGAGNVWP